MNILEIKSLNKQYGQLKALDNVNLDVARSSVFGLLGPNGAGKSTLLKIMTGLYSIESGDIYYFDYNMKYDFEKCMAIIGTLIESPDLYKNLTGKENLELFKSMFKGIDENTIKEIVNIVEMEKYLGKKFKTYSLGMKERLGIANALINKPRILILDEPTNGLDPIGIKKIMDILSNMKDTTIIISSHLLSEIECLCDKIIFINNGEVVKIKQIDKTVKKKNIKIEVDDYSKAKIILNKYCINDELEFYETDEMISRMNKELIFNNINVYRIYESENSLEKEFFDMVNNDKTNK